VEIAFNDPTIRSIVERRKRAIATLGNEAARELRHRITDLLAMPNAREFMDLFPEQVIDHGNGVCVVLIGLYCRLAYQSGHVRTPLDTNGMTDWSRVTRIKIISLGHEDE
jgi:hypothetical protein